MAASRSGKSRFTLLLLEDGEVLLSDLVVQYHFIPDSTIGSAQHPTNAYLQRFVLRSKNSSIRGRVKLGTKNIFFDSEEWRDPVIRIPLVSAEYARANRDNSRSHSSDDDWVHPGLPAETDDENSVVIYARKAVFQREMGSDHPYVEVEMKGKHVFTPLYSSAPQLLDDINGLLKITATSSRRVRDEKLRNLVQERESRVPFDITLLEHGVQESTSMDEAASAVYAMSRAPGRFRVTSLNVYFMPIHGESTQAVERIPIRKIKTLRRLRHGCLNAALEIGFEGNDDLTHPLSISTLMVSFQSFRAREKAVDTLQFSASDIETFDRRELEIALNKWRRGHMSNFDYLLYVNMAAGRSFNDLSQYPVFPWILSEYDSDVLDLSRESTFRDLSRPIGALEPERLSTLTERYNEMPPPRFFYGTHYSTPAYTINYLVRAAPAAMLRLQNGRFDNPDRLFHSLRDTWRGVLRNQGDVKELIPEFFSTDFRLGNASGIVSRNSSPGEFLDNVLGLDLGTRQDGKRVDDVELPPWAKGSSERFVRRHREALESIIVSSKLHAWIDLIFGVKSRNVEAANVFYTDVALPSSIESVVTANLTAEEMSQIETVYLEFGRTPEQLFRHPHPPRFGDMQLIARSDGAYLSKESTENELGDPATRRDRLLLRKSKGMEKFPLGTMEQVKRHLPSTSTPHLTAGGPAVSALNRTVPVRSGRHDSVLGRNEHILSKFELLCHSARAVDGSQNTHFPIISNMIHLSEPNSSDLNIVDMCLISRSVQANSDTHFERDDMGNEIPVICTAWNDGYLRVHSIDKTLRSKHVGAIRTVVYIHSGVIAYGTPSGTIGLYYIDTGRTEEVLCVAHDAEIHALEYVAEGQIIISGSKDASVKVWRFDRQSNRIITMILIQELDAESSIVEICGSMTVFSQSSDGNETPHLLVAAATSDEALMAWELELCSEDQTFLEPNWKRESSVTGVNSQNTSASKRCRKLAWLCQGETRKPLLACVHSDENCVRVWSLDDTKMAIAEVFLSDHRALCITSYADSRTLLVGGEDGEIREFDSTGLFLGRISAGGKEVRGILIPERGMCIYVFSGPNEVLLVNL